ncbi:MAG: hypothetical protein ABIP61_13970 [Burkholderiaceae bacterium]
MVPRFGGSDPDHSTETTALGSPENEAGFSLRRFTDAAPHPGQRLEGGEQINAGATEKLSDSQPNCRQRMPSVAA